MEKPLTQNIQPDRVPLDLKAIERADGYQGLRRALKMAPTEVTDLVKRSDLKGRGGAGFPTGMKWSFVPMGEDAPRPKYMIVNADEMEPGTFKDRLLLEGDPHMVIEGTIISAYAIQAEVGYIFLRWAYKEAERRLRKAIAEAYEAGYLGKNIFGSGFDFDLHLHVSAGRYMCGEETGLLNSLEGRRATVRPIAGTRPRGKSPVEDLELERDLLADPKERAEHVMLVDLARNDLGRVCEFGSVRVPEQMVI